MERFVSWLGWGLLIFISPIIAYVEVPKFSQLILLYPGYHHNGGHYRKHDLEEIIGSNHGNFIRYLHNTAPLRLSVALNRYGGRHAIGQDPISADSVVGSILGRDSQQYVFDNIAFGPFLAGKYGNPQIIRPEKGDKLTLEEFQGHQGIIRFVTYHKDHAGGHIGLWDCDHLYQTPDWLSTHHMIAVELWETPDSYCPPNSHDPEIPIADLSFAAPEYQIIESILPGSAENAARHSANSEKSDQNLPVTNEERVRNTHTSKHRHRPSRKHQRLKV